MVVVMVVMMAMVVVVVVVVVVMLSVIISVLAFCPSVTLKKMSYEGLVHHHENYPKL